MLRGMLDRPVSVGVATVALVVIGAASLLRLPVSLLPTLDRPRLEVVALDAERSREELLRLVAAPLERRFLALAGVVEVTSTVADGRCRLTLETEWQTDVDRVRIDAVRRLAEVAGLGLDELEIRIEAGDRRPILEIAVLGGSSAHARTVFADEVLIPELGRLAGAGRLRRFGGALRRPVVRPRAAALAARGLSAAEVVERLARLGQSEPLGELRDGAVVRPMVLRETIASLAALDGLRLGTSETTLGEVATVELEAVSDTSRFRQGGEDAVLVELHRAPGANAVLLARRAREALAALEERSRSASLRLEVSRDASREVVDALAGLALAGCLGLGLGTLVLRFMLGSWRPTLALMAVVPASLVASFAGFFLWGVSLDLVSLAGLALAAGMLVDNSIVVLEAIEVARRRDDRRDGAAAGGEDAATRGTRQIALALVASFLTTAVVFLPLIYLRGLARAFFGVQAFAIVTALALSLALSLTLTPILSRSAGNHPHRGRSPGHQLYLATLDSALRRPWTVILTLALVLAGGLAVLSQLPRELVPRGATRTLAVELELPPGSTPAASAARLEALEAGLERSLARTAPGSAWRLLYHGRDALRRLSTDEEERGELQVVVPAGADPDAVRRAIEGELARSPGVRAVVRLRRGAVAAALERSRGPAEIEASAATPERAAALADRLVARLAPLGEAAHRRAARSGREPEAWVVRWDAFRFSELGGDPEMVVGQVRSALGGMLAGRVAIEGIEPEILVEATSPGVPSLLPVRPLTHGSAPTLPLTALATLERRAPRGVLERSNGRPVAQVVVDPASGLAPAEISARLAGLPLALDEDVRLVGQARELERSFRQLRQALALALILVFLTVAALYESLTLPFAVMVTVPVAVAGAFAGLWLGGQSLNVMSFLGLILLAGIVVNNAIVLVHRIEQRRAGAEAGTDPLDAVRTAAGERYRPIVMTTVTTLLGMVPLAALGGEGVELRRALAVAVCGGLSTSLFATLWGVPVLHRVLVRRTPALASREVAVDEDAAA